MRVRNYIAALLADWLALMSGIASVVLAFWAAYFPPPNVQAGRTLLWITAVACFAVSSYRIWAKEYDAREKEVTELRANQAVALEQKEEQHQTKLVNLIDEHTRVSINQEKKHSDEVEGLRARIDSLKSQLDVLNKQRLIFEVANKYECRITLYYEKTKVLSHAFDRYMVTSQIKIRFENGSTRPIRAKGIKVSLLRETKKGREREIQQETSYTDVLEGTNKIEPSDLVVSAGSTTNDYLLRSYISLPDRVWKRLNRSCFLRIALEAVGQPPYVMDLDANWDKAHDGGTNLIPRL